MRKEAKHEGFFGLAAMRKEAKHEGFFLVWRDEKGGKAIIIYCRL